jgi:hypothetical protein
MLAKNLVRQLPHCHNGSYATVIGLSIVPKVYMAGEAVLLYCLISSHTCSIRLCTCMVIGHWLALHVLPLCSVLWSLYHKGEFMHMWRSCWRIVARCFGRQGRSSTLPLLLNFRTSLTIVLWSLLNRWRLLINSNYIHTL